MMDNNTAPFGALVLRVSLGAMGLAHAGLKYFTFTPDGTAQFFQSLGLPPELGYVTIAVEVITGIALIVGLATRLAATVMIPILLGSIAFVHGSNGWLFTAEGGGWEFPAFWAAGLLVQSLLGDGAYAISPRPIMRAVQA